MSSTEKSETERIHLIGIGGIGMSALARFYLYNHKVVSGSDRIASDITARLMEEGAHIYTPQQESNITPDIKLVVYTEAMAHDHEEMVAARRLGVPMMNYFDALGSIANEYYLIAVAGAHGKTTTTAMLADILEEAGLDPTVIVGSLRAKTGSNFRPGESKYAIVEACEYKRDFLSLEPDVLVITNIDFEHVDYYSSLEDVQSAFRELARKIPEHGAVIADVRNPKVLPVVEGLTCAVIDYKPEISLTLPLKYPGLHMRQNAAAAITAARFIGVSSEVSDQALKEFAGTWRRFEYKGEIAGAPVYDDYGHHPTEMLATIAGARELYPNKKLMVVFQPHTYSRTAELFEDFVSALTKADTSILLPIYAAREENTSGVSSVQLQAAVSEKGAHSMYYSTQAEVINYVRSSVTEDMVVVVMGAGNITEVAKKLTN